MALPSSVAANFATVLEDTVNQLYILGKIMPVSLQSNAKSNKLINQEISSAIGHQRETEAKLESILSARGDNSKAGPAVQELIGSLSHTNRGADQSMRQSPLTKDNFIKVQQDRQFCETVLERTQQELVTGSTYSYLVDAVMQQKQTKIGLQRTIIKEEEGRRKIKHLQRKLQDIRKEKEEEIQRRNEMIAHLKDQLQEMKAKSNMEGKYVKKNAENKVHQNQQKCQIEEQQKKDLAEKLKSDIDSEVRTHMEIETFLGNHQKILEEKVEYWMHKYDTDVESKQKELSELKTSKSNDYERLQELIRRYAEYEKVVVEDRIEKEKERRRREQEELELNSAVRLQSWWRGTMVTKQLGPFGKKKKKGGKKGKKGKGKKKK